MYVSYVNEVPKNFFLKNTGLFYRDIYLTAFKEQENILEFINQFGFNEYKSLFDTVGIKYDTIADNGLSYTVKKSKNLLLYSLSSGERILLYSLIMSALNKPVIILGLIDRMDKKHRDVLSKYPELFKTLIVLTYRRMPVNQDIVDSFYKPFDKILEEGII